MRLNCLRSTDGFITNISFYYSVMIMAAPYNFNPINYYIDKL
jgi:hypothetical protein